MIEQLLALSMTGEVLVAGPLPSKVQADPRGAQARFPPRPNPRGWITRKKEPGGRAGRCDNVGLPARPYSVTSPAGLDAAAGGAGYPGVFTFPQLYFPTYSRVSFSRHLDYQVILPTMTWTRRFRLGSYRPLGFPTADRHSLSIRDTTIFASMHSARRRPSSRARAFFARFPLDERLHHNENEDTEYGFAATDSEFLIA